MIWNQWTFLYRSRQDCGLASLACSAIHVIIHIQISFFRNSLSKYILFSTYLIKSRSLLNVYRRCQCRKIVRKTQLCLCFDEKNQPSSLLVQNEAECFQSFHFFGQNMSFWNGVSSFLQQVVFLCFRPFLWKTTILCTPHKEIFCRSSSQKTSNSICFKKSLSSSFLLFYYYRRQRQW